MFWARIQVPAVDQIDVPAFAGLEGYSHFPFFFADNFDFATQHDHRRLRVPDFAVLDAGGNGYDIVAPFRGDGPRAVHVDDDHARVRGARLRIPAQDKDRAPIEAPTRGLLRRGPNAHVS